MRPVPHFEGQDLHWTGEDSCCCSVQPVSLACPSAYVLWAHAALAALAAAAAVSLAALAVAAAAVVSPEEEVRLPALPPAKASSLLTPFGLPFLALDIL